MFSRRLLVALLAAFLLVSVTQSKPKKDKKKDKGASKRDLEELTDELNAIKDRLDHLEGGDDAAGSRVHFFFHGDDHAPEHVDSDSVNVHVHIPHDDHHGEDHFHEAHCEMHGDNEKIHGHVHIVQESGESSAHFHVNFDYLGEAEGGYDLHVHEFGDVSNGCESVGGHYMPTEGVDGDIGHVTVESDGSVNTWINDTTLSLEGRYSVIGRSVKIHEPLTSAPLACCVIGWSEEMDSHGHHGHEMMEHHHHGGHM